MTADPAITLAMRLRRGLAAVEAERRHSVVWPEVWKAHVDDCLEAANTLSQSHRAQSPQSTITPLVVYLPQAATAAEVTAVLAPYYADGWRIVAAWPWVCFLERAAS